MDSSRGFRIYSIYFTCVFHVLVVQNGVVDVVAAVHVVAVHVAEELFAAMRAVAVQLSALAGFSVAAGHVEPQRVAVVLVVDCVGRVRVVAAEQPAYLTLQPAEFSQPVVFLQTVDRHYFGSLAAPLRVACLHYYGQPAVSWRLAGLQY